MSLEISPIPCERELRGKEPFGPPSQTTSDPAPARSNRCRGAHPRRGSLFVAAGRPGRRRGYGTHGSARRREPTGRTGRVGYVDEDRNICAADRQHNNAPAGSKQSQARISKCDPGNLPSPPRRFAGLHRPAAVSRPGRLACTVLAEPPAYSLGGRHLRWPGLACPGETRARTSRPCSPAAAASA
jgi:hypothetical protein